MKRWLAVLVATVGLTACSGIPTTSPPQVVRSVGGEETAASSAPAPAPGIDPRSVVLGFLAANTDDPDRHNAARQYLTADTAQKWQDTTATIIDAPARVDLADPSNSVTVHYDRVGQLSANGVYTPQLVSNGEEPATFSVIKEKGQWRINGLPAGLLLTSDDFRNYFARPLYFLAGTGSPGNRLVPDIRWSALGGQSLASFLLTQLVAGPRPELANAVSSEVPVQAAAQRVSVTVGTPSKVQLPGTAGLDAGSRTRLAAQLAYTLRVNGFGSSLTVLDGPNPVQFPVFGTRAFQQSDFAQFAPIAPGAPTPTVTFVRGGAVYDATGKPVSGVLGTARYGLTSAVFHRSGTGVEVAGTTGPATMSTLLIGDSASLAATDVPAGPLTRPAWAPGGDEAWVASGSTVYRAAPGKPSSPVAQTSGRPINGTIVALTFSPEGSRLALVILGEDGSSQVWLGSVVRNGPDVRLDQLEPITPPTISLSDVGWRGDTSLLAVGQDPSRSAGQGGFWQLRVDGAQLTYTGADDLAGLPDAPRTLAVSPNSEAWWVTVGAVPDSTVWERLTSASGWAAPSGAPSEAGSAPAFSG